MKPVHSSLLPLLVLPGHFHAITVPRCRWKNSSGDQHAHCSGMRRLGKERCTKICDKVVECATERKDSRRVAMLKQFQATNLLHQAIVEPHQLAVLIVFEDQLARTELGAFP